MSVPAADQQIINRAGVIADQLLDPNPQQQQRAQQQHADPEQDARVRVPPRVAIEEQRLEEKAAEPQDLPAEQHAQPLDNVEGDQINPAHAQGGNPEDNLLRDGRSPQTYQLIRRLLRALPLASDNQLQQMYNIFTSDVLPQANPVPPHANPNAYPQTLPAYQGPPNPRVSPAVPLPPSVSTLSRSGSWLSR